MKFVKSEATGNDFVIIDARKVTGEDWPEMAQSICARRHGVGADGIILLTESSRADVGMRIFNADGSEAEMCGNGLRCLAKYVVDRGIVPTSAFSVQTLSGIKQIETHSEGGKVLRVRVALGIPSFRAEDIPFASGPDKLKSDRAALTDCTVNAAGRDVTVSLVSMGNPHAVAFTDVPLSEFSLSSIGPAVETHRSFPRRINFEVARVRDHHSVEVRVWERGVGETLSCGSGACAVAAVCKAKGLVGDVVDISLPGGILTVSRGTAGELWLAGPVNEIFSGEWIK